MRISPRHSRDCVGASLRRVRRTKSCHHRQSDSERDACCRYRHGGERLPAQTSGHRNVNLGPDGRSAALPPRSSRAHVLLIYGALRTARFVGPKRAARLVPALLSAAVCHIKYGTGRLIGPDESGDRARRALASSRLRGNRHTGHRTTVLTHQPFAIRDACLPGRSARPSGLLKRTEKVVRCVRTAP